MRCAEARPGARVALRERSAQFRGNARISGRGRGKSLARNLIQCGPDCLHYGISNSAEPRTKEPPVNCRQLKYQRNRSMAQTIHTIRFHQHSAGKSQGVLLSRQRNEQHRGQPLRCGARLRNDRRTPARLRVPRTRWEINPHYVAGVHQWLVYPRTFPTTMPPAIAIAPVPGPIQVTSELRSKGSTARQSAFPRRGRSFAH